MKSRFRTVEREFRRLQPVWTFNPWSMLLIVFSALLSTRTLRRDEGPHMSVRLVCMWPVVLTKTQPCWLTLQIFSRQTCMCLYVYMSRQLICRWSLGSVYMKLNTELKYVAFASWWVCSLKVKPIDPSLYINRFASQMEFGDQLSVCSPNGLDDNIIGRLPDRTSSDQENATWLDCSWSSSSWNCGGLAFIGCTCSWIPTYVEWWWW